MQATWGWERYERTSWRDAAGRKCYFGHFRKDIEGTIGPHMTWDSCVVRFWAHKPILALRHIARSGKHPADFADAQVN